MKYEELVKYLVEAGKYDEAKEVLSLTSKQKDSVAFIKERIPRLEKFATSLKSQLRRVNSDPKLVAKEIQAVARNMQFTAAAISEAAKKLG